jgi:tetratricopeptide (TPR) repeat protein
MEEKQLNEQERNEELIEIGIEAHEAKDYQKALDAFLKITPSFEQYDIVRGEIISFYYNLGNYEEVIRLAKLETEENDSYSIIVANRMRAHLNLEQYQEILDFYKNSTISLDEDAKEHYLISVQNAAMAVNDDNLAAEIAAQLNNMYIKLGKDSTTYTAF